ncbi:MAG: GlgC family sugar phosphate nucleotidyltransferase [Promethearchaeota archaeon]
MKELLQQLESLLSEKEIDIVKIKEVKSKLLKEHITGLKIDNYIGDYPTFMEPVILGDKVKIGDDVLIGPKVYIGANSEIEDYAEISNCIIFDDVKIGKNFKLDNCVILKGSKLNFNNFSNQNCILRGKAESKEELEIILL